MRTVLCMLFLAACSGSDTADDGTDPYGTPGEVPLEETSSPEDTGAPVGADRVSLILDLAGDETAGERAFAATCAGCHGADGSGGSGPDLNARVPNRTDERIVKTVLDGVGAMPSFDSESDQTIADLHAFLVGSFR